MLGPRRPQSRSASSRRPKGGRQSARPTWRAASPRLALEALDTGEHGAWASQASVPKREHALRGGTYGPGASVTQDPGASTSSRSQAASICHGMERGKHLHRLSENLAAACIRCVYTSASARVCAALTWVRVRARGACVGASPLRQPAHDHTGSRGGATHSAHQPCGLEALDAGGQGAWASQASIPKRELARPKESRQSARPTRLARGVAATPTKKAAKVTNTLSCRH